MSDHIRKTIEEMEGKRQEQLSELGRTERTINDLLAFLKEPPRFAEPGARDNVVSSSSIQRGQFYGVPLATAVGDFLSTRRRVPAITDEILDALNHGGFDFDALDWKPETRTRSLAMSLSKNTLKFHRLPDQSWGLREWYPGVGVQKKKGDAPASTSASASASASPSPSAESDEEDEK